MITAAQARVFIILALAAALVVQAGRLAWVFLEPVSPPDLAQAGPARPAPAADLTVAERFNPFEDAASAAPPQGAPTAGGLILYGVRAGPGGTAIIGGPGAAQKVFRVGEQVTSGVTLSAIAADHVMLRQGGLQTRLALNPASGPAPPAGGYTAPPPKAP